MKNLSLESSIVIAAEGQVSCDVAGETVLLSLKSGEYYGLNAVATRIWDLIQAPKTVNEVLHVLLEEYDIEPERCERELLTLLRALVDKGLIEVNNGTTA